MPLGLGLQGEIGEIVAGSERADFPRQTERLILSVAANQASIGLQGARLLSEQKACRERTRSPGRATDQRTCRSQRRAATPGGPAATYSGRGLDAQAGWNTGFRQPKLAGVYRSGTRLRPVGSRGLDDGDPPRGSGDGVQLAFGAVCAQGRDLPIEARFRRASRRGLSLASQSSCSTA